LGRPADDLTPARHKSEEIRPTRLGAPASIPSATAIPFCLRGSTWH